MNKRIFYTLLTSFIGDQFYILFVSAVLLKMGYSSSFVAGAIALTSIPNLLFGPYLGRLVDKSDKVKLHTRLNIGLALIVNILGLIVYQMDKSMLSMVLIALIMIVYNFLYSPLNTLLYHYIIPTLGVDESKVFLKWEKFQSIGIFLSAIFCFLIIKIDLQNILLPIDGLTFLVSAFIIEKNVNIARPQQQEVDDKQSFKMGFRKIDTLLNVNFNKKLLLISMLAIFAFIFAVDAQIYNSGILFLNQFKLELAYVPLLIASLSLFNVFGASLYEKYFNTSNNLKAHNLSLIVIAVALGIIFYSLITSTIYFILIGLILIQFVEPVWSSTNAVLLRSQIKKDKYGEFFGYFRIIRSLITSGSIFTFGLAQSHHLLSLYIIVGLFIIGAIALYAITFTQHKEELCQTN